MGFLLLATCPGGRERLIDPRDPRDATWHHLLPRAGRRDGRAAVVSAQGFDIVRAMTALDVAASERE